MQLFRKRKRKQFTATDILMIEISRKQYEFDKLVYSQCNGKKHSYADAHPAGINVIF